MIRIRASLLLVGSLVVHTAVLRALEAVPWRIGPTPILEIGRFRTESDPHDELFQVEDAALTRSGSIVVVNRGSNEVREYSSEGALLAVMGRGGVGPREFRAVSQVEVAPDVLLGSGRGSKAEGIVLLHRLDRRASGMESSACLSPSATSGYRQLSR